MGTRLCPPDNHPQSNRDNSFFSGQTVYENTAYRLDDRDWPEDEIERAVVEILTFVGLENDQEKQAEDLSGGIRQKLREITSLYNGRIRTGFATPGEERSNRSSSHSL